MVIPGTEQVVDRPIPCAVACSSLPPVIATGSTAHPPIEAAMKSLALIIANVLLAVSLHAGDAGIGQSFTGPVGLQLYSLRAEFAANGVAATLDKVKGYGIKYVELAGTYTLPADKYKAMLDERGLIPVSGHFPYARFKSEPEVVAKEAKALGLSYAGVAWVDHKDPWDEKQCRETIEVFNKAGAALAAAGVTFFYHLHGYEFQPHGDGTLVAGPIIPTGGQPRGLEIIDLNQDGWPDIIPATENSQITRAIMGRRSRAFMDGSDINLVTLGTSGIVAGDFNNDTKLDLAVTFQNGPTGIMLAN